MPAALRLDVPSNACDPLPMLRYRSALAARPHWQIATVLLTSAFLMPGPAASAGIFCFEGNGGEQIILHGLGGKIGKKKNKPIAGYVATADAVRPLSGAYVTNVAGTAIALGLTEPKAGLSSFDGYSVSTATRFHQIGFRERDQKLDINDAGTDCTWEGSGPGTSSPGCTSLKVIDCKTAKGIP